MDFSFFFDFFGGRGGVGYGLGYGLGGDAELLLVESGLKAGLEVSLETVCVETARLEGGTELCDLVLLVL